MNNEELKTITDLIVKNCEPSKISEVILSMFNFADKQPVQTISNQEQLFFTEQEIKKMPKEFRCDGCTAHIRKRQVSKNAYTYVIRYRRNGYNVEITDKSLMKAKARFLVALTTATKKRSQRVTKTSFNTFAMYYFETFRKRKVSEKTYYNDLSRYNKYIKPFFGETDMRTITSDKCQELLDAISNEGKGKTADEIYSLMNVIFKCAINHNHIEHNPLDVCIHEKHEREHGVALSKDEEKTLKEYFKNSKYLPTIMMSLYTGVRPNELSSIVIKDNMIIANNSKRHNKKVETKRIPISKMLKPYITENFKSANPEKVRDEVKKCLPNHKYYDLRTTFYSRCKECGIEIYAIEEYMGHSLGAIGNSYTDLSDEYLIKEMEKFAY